MGSEVYRIERLDWFSKYWDGKSEDQKQRKKGGAWDTGKKGLEQDSLEGKESSLGKTSKISYPKQSNTFFQRLVRTQNS